MKPKKNKKKVTAAAIKFGGAFKQVLMAAATHPTTAALAVMTMAVITKEFVTQGKADTEWRIRFNGEMKGIYEGAQALGLASALAPVAMGALGVAQAGIEAAAKKSVPTGYP